MSSYEPKESSDQFDTGSSIDETQSFLHKRQQQKRQHTRTASAVIGVLSLTVLCLLVIAYADTASFVRPGAQHDSTADEYKGQWTNCGLTIDDALSRNCIFDMMGNNWVPSLCHNSAFASSSETDNGSYAQLCHTTEFPWYADQFRKEQIPRAELEGNLVAKARREAIGEVTVFTSESWQIAHCMYWFSVGTHALERLSHRESDVWVPRVVRKLEHARHCSVITGDAVAQRAKTGDDKKVMLSLGILGMLLVCSCRRLRISLRLLCVFGYTCMFGQGTQSVVGRIYQLHYFTLQRTALANNSCPSKALTSQLYSISVREFPYFMRASE